MQIESIRTQLEEFERNLNQELYQYFSGQKSRLDLAPVYADFSDVFSAENIGEIEREYKNTKESFGGRRKNLKKICEFLIDQHMDSAVAKLVQESARLEAEQTLIWEGKEIALVRVPGYLKSEADAGKRRNLNDRYARALSRMDLKPEIAAQLNRAAVGLGFPGYADARERTSGTNFKQLLDSLRPVLDRLQDRYMEQLRVSFETTLGLALNECGSWDVAHWRLKNDQSRIFPAEGLLPVLDAAASELGIQPESPKAVFFDLEPRAQKHPRPCCIPISIPRDIRIVVNPGSGAGNYAALLHEGGHAYHFAWTAASLPVEHRIWGDRALCEGYAFLIEHLLHDAQWLRRLISFTESGDFLRFEALHRMYLVRQHAGKLCFAVDYYERTRREEMPQLYAETMHAFTGLHHNPELWVNELPDGFASAAYLRGWILESMLRTYLRSKYGNLWFTSRSASGFLKEIWETGQLYRAEELCREIGLGDLDVQILADDILEGLR